MSKWRTHLRLGTLAFSLFFLVNLSVAEIAAPETKEGAATQEISKPAETPEQTPAQKVTQKNTIKRPSTEKKEVLPRAGKSIVEKPTEETAAPQGKRREGAHKVPQEAKRDPADQKGAGEAAVPVPESEPKVTGKGDTEPPSPPAKEAGKPREEKTVVHKEAPKKAEGEEESLFSVEEAEEARRGEMGIHKKMEEQKDKDETLFSVEEAEKAAEHRVTPPLEKPRKPTTVEREAEYKDKRGEGRVSVRRRKEKKEWEKIELGFGYKDVTLLQGSYSFETHFVGEMVNETGRDYGIVKFMFSTYDKRGKLITEEPFQITDFYNGQIKTFNGTVIDTYKDIASHKIRFISAAPTARE